jgi:hypothetical protein
MSLGRFLVEKHTRIAAVVFPVSVLGGLAYTMKTGASPLADGKDWVQGMCVDKVASILFNSASAGSAVPIIAFW